jgi:hypothetical protein
MELTASVHRQLKEPSPSRRRPTALARKRRHARLMRTLAAANNLHKPSPAQIGLLATLATMLLRVEELRGVAIRGELADADELVRLASETRRVAHALGIALKAEPAHVPTLAEYLAERRAADPCRDEDVAATDGDEDDDAHGDEAGE